MLFVVPMQSFVDEASYTGNRTINMPEEDPNAYYYGKSVYTKKRCTEQDIGSDA